VSPDSDPLRDPALYINRELSQLDFNFRVLAQAMDPQVPLLERLRFMCISCTNLDEFFEIRAAAVRHAQEFGLPPAPDGMSPQAILNAIHDRAAELVDQQYRCWNQTLRPALAEAGIGVLGRHSWNHRQKRWLRAYFRNEIMPVLSPLGLDPVHPFPKILNKSLNIVVVLKGTDAFGRAGHLAIVRAPRSLPRIIQLPESLGGGQNFVFLSSVLSAFVDELFPGMEVQGAYQFRVTRNSELVVDEEEVENLALALRDELVDRGYRPAVRLEIAEDTPKDIVRTLLQNFGLTENAVYRIDGPVNLNRIIQLYDLVPQPDLKYPPMNPRTLRDSDGIFEIARRQDLLLHHPFDAFTAVLDLIKQAAVDPNVLAIKQTLYRTGKDSLIVDALIQAARNGKDVTVVVELRARFDEEANLGLADRLQEAGVQVVYGVVGYKTHAKMLLIVRREGRKLRRYVHLGTGNYHSGTRVHRHRPDHRRCGYRQRRAPAVPAAVGAGLEDEAQAPAAVALHPAHRHSRPHRARDARRRHRSPGAHHRQDERTERTAGGARAVRRLAGRGADRPDHPWRLHSAPGRAGGVGQHPRALHCRPLPGAQPRVLVRQRRRAGDVLRQRRLAGTQPAAPGRNRLPDPGPGTGQAGLPRSAAELPGRQPQRVGAGCRRRVPQARPGPRRSAAFGADGADAGAVIR